MGYGTKCGMARFRWAAVILLALSSTILFAADAALDWPADKPVLHFEIGKFNKAGSFGNRNVFNIDVVTKNVSATRISYATFHLYLLDAQKTRIAEHWVTLTNVDPGATVKSVITSQVVGVPVEFAVAADHLPQELAYLNGPTTTSVTIETIPSGANLTVDGTAAGKTPVTMSVAVGSHAIAFSKDGFAGDTATLSVAADQAAGKTYSFELGGALHDTVELRDGTIISGDVIAVSESEIVVRGSDGEQKYVRALVKRVSFVEKTEAAK
ncbi:PEGA domain protein [Candidatus Koribacter versatilis Ellin345]|uniref:PEGA domain protein n=2 Tax=Candidatus Korobacter versatilis TaxID=658062 RepID=Q1IN84_KORVE|nr:PEGA domain protein [Candidatus Koribacter versatilis Ellin345]